MSLYDKTKVLMIKPEVTYGTDSVPTGAANAILATDFRLMAMEGQDVSREVEMPWMGPQGTIAAGLHSKISFKVELKGSGTAGTAPAYGPLLRACGMSEVIVATTSVTYARVSTAISSVSIYFDWGGTRYVMLGARGTVVERMTAQGIVYLEFTFTGVYTAPATQVPATPTFGTQLTLMPRVASRANTPVFTIGGTAHVLRAFSFDFGSQVEPRLLVNEEEIIIVDSAEKAEFTIEAVALATLNPFALAGSGATVALVLTHGTAAGNIVTLNLPRLQLQRPSSIGAQQGIKEWSLAGIPLPNAGNDQFTLVLT